MSYKEHINNLCKSIPPEIVDLSAIRKRGKAPTQAFSEFLTHSEQGDWAECLVSQALSNDFPYVPVKYGKSDKITAGDPGFKAFYDKYQTELDTIGKRPDILLFPEDKYKSAWGHDVSNLSIEELNEIVPNAIAGLEVRSSAYLTKKFIANEGRTNLSFTPKIEDLFVVLKWVNTYGIPHFYIQVFYDSIFIISFSDILSLLGNAKLVGRGIKKKVIQGFVDNNLAFGIEQNPKNQFKETLHLNLRCGHIISKDVVKPEIIAKEKILENGRLLHYVHFTGGNAVIDSSKLTDILKNVPE